MSAAPHPKIQVDVTADLARALLADQHPDLADLPLHGRVFGWDNVTWRLGDALALRFPVRDLSSTLVEREQRWLAAGKKYWRPNSADVTDRVNIAESPYSPSVVPSESVPDPLNVPIDQSGSF